MYYLKNFINKITFWFSCARCYSLPITILNWLVAFLYGIKHHGNYYLGILALIGICFVHLATNLIDDLFDYKILSQDEKYLNSAQNCKCWYLKENKATLSELKKVILTFLGLAALIGLILFLKSGIYVAIFALVGLIIAFSYQRLSLIGLGDIGVIIAFGPLLYLGVYYVMTKSFSTELLLLSLSCVFFTNTILYNHMLMDFDGDKQSHKKTLCTILKTKENALNMLLTFYITAYILIIVLANISKNYLYLMCFFTTPQIIEIYNYMKLYNKDKLNLPQIKFWHYPLDNWEKVSKTQDAPFYFRFFYSRNIVTNYLILVSLSIILNK